MRKRWLVIAGAVVVLGALLFGGAALAQGAMGGNGAFGGYGPGGMMNGRGWWGSGAQAGSSATPGPGYMMGNGGMMGNGYGPGGMMGGYGGSQNASSAAPVTGNSVTIQNFAFQPANLQVKVGTTVTWTNQDTAPHTITFRDSSLTSSGMLQKGETYSYTFTKTGTFAYYCQVHPNMTAQVVVTA